MKLPRLFLDPKFWGFSFLIWFVVLWLLSSTTPSGPPGLEIPHFDKIAHFAYFFGGAILFSAFLFRRQPHLPNWRKSALIVILLLACVGLLDEYHQTFTPGRTGGDPYDWTADLLGTIAGVCVFRYIHPRFK